MGFFTNIDVASIAVKIVRLANPVSVTIMLAVRT